MWSISVSTTLNSTECVYGVNQIRPPFNKDWDSDGIFVVPKPSSLSSNPNPVLGMKMSVDILQSFDI